MSTDLPPVEPPQTPAPAPAKPRGAIWMRVLLIGSLALNLAVAGLVIGFVVNDGPREARRGSGGSAAERAIRDTGLGPLGSALAKKDRKELRAAAWEKRAEARELRRTLRDTFTDLMPLLRADEFDTSAAREILAQQRAAASEVHSLAHSLVVDHFATMSQEDRAALADRLEEKLKQRPRGLKGPKRD